VKDFIQEQVEGSFDGIVLLDVYEHFPASVRSVVHERLKNLLRVESCVILTVPTPGYQRYLREREPEGLQSVDEDVTCDDCSMLASDLGGHVVLERSISIWRADDYMHVLIQRGSSRGEPQHALDWKTPANAGPDSTPAGHPLD
jgi:hypothetical protein